VRFTIERMRTLVLAAGVLLVVALGVFLAIGRFKSPFNRRDIPKRLGIDIEQEANGVTYTQAHGGHTLFKIHASKVVQLKNDHALLHDVQIELYGADGSRVDRIVGSEFEYDQKSGTATAAGPVEITLMRPSVAPAVAPKASPEQAIGSKGQKSALAATAQAAAGGEIHVKTSGLTFDQQSEVATTTQHVDFSMAQGSGSSMGATYDSQRGYLSLNHAVELTTRRGADPVVIHAGFADFDRDSDVCDLNGATAEYRGGQATAAEARILFREDGTAQRLYATGGFTLSTATGGHLAAPKGTMDFDERNQPRHGRLEGGVTMDSTSGARTVHGTSPAAELEFTAAGELHAMQMEQSVELESNETGQTEVKGRLVPVRMSRTWRSPMAEVEFRDVEQGETRGQGTHGQGRVEPASMRGEGGVVMTAMEQRGNAAASQSKLVADAVTGTFGPSSSLTAMTGVGHASMEQTTVTGTHETAAGDRLEVQFAPAGAKTASTPKAGPGAALGTGLATGAAETEVESATLDGHVTLVQQPAPKPGAQPQPTPEMHATAAHAVYESAGQWLHLTGSPRVTDGGLEMAADKIDVTQDSGDAFAHGDVKATWMNAAGQQAARPAGMTLGGQGPAHVVAAEAELHQATGVAIFRGAARLWQQVNSVQVNSVAAPLIEIDRKQQTLTAKSQDRGNPVRAVLVSAGKTEGAHRDGGNGAGRGDGLGQSRPGQSRPDEARPGQSRPDQSRPNQSAAKPAAPAVIRVRGGDLWYSDAERKATMQGGVLGAVTAETGTATTVSNDVELVLTPAAGHAASGQITSGQATNGQASSGQAAGGQAGVERMTATGRVVVSSQGRRGTGERLVYTQADGNYVLTGTPATPPEMTDPERGSVTGEALIFHSRDDSVSIEGGPQATVTRTTAPK
jgi:lipopolysaccharide export system protein LptA